MTALNDDTTRTASEPNGPGRPERIGRYELLDRIGKGGMGVVYRARDTQLDRLVALKMIVTELAEESETRERFIREARAAADLNHPNIIKIYDFGEQSGRAYIAMELLAGRNLVQVLEDEERIPIESWMKVMRGVSAGLSFAHARAIVHRDLKPGNLFLPDNGWVKILDFGLARIASSKLTRSGLVFGTPDYMSPEQVRGKVVDHRSDIFSFGAVCYHLVAGRKPFAAGSLPMVMRRVLEEDPEPLAETSPMVARIIWKALQKDPAARYQTMDELRADLDRVGESEDEEEEEEEATVLIQPNPARAGFPQIDRYRIVERIGRGGMGVVYRAHDPVLDRDVAIKSILGDFSSSAGAAEQFEREARAAARLQHANIITIYELGTAEESPYIVMEFLAGVDLEAMMHARRRPPLAARVDMVMQLCAGLSYAHQQGVVHRDIKPSNVRVLDDGTIKLIDFGIAKVSRSGPTFPDLAGSVAYTSPEQLHGAGVDARSDVFSVGVLMYELFGGRPPFVGDSPTAIAYQVLNHDPSPVATIDADVPEVLSDVVARALEKSPERRYEDAAALAEALAAAASEVPSHGLDQPFGEGRSSDLLLRSRAAQSDGYANVGLSGDSVKTPPPETGRRRSRRIVAIAASALALLVPVGGAVVWRQLVTRELPSVLQIPPPPVTGPGAVLALTVESDPPGARILIAGADYRGMGGVPIALTTPATLPFRGAFPDAVELRRSGYDPVEVLVPGGEGPVRVVAAALDERPLGAVAVSGTYPFEVWTGGRRLSGAATDHVVRLIAGPVTLRLRNPEVFLDQRFRVQVGPDQEARLRAPPLGRLTVYSRPGNCEILVDGQVVGFPPVLNHRVVAGGHSIARKCPNGEQDATESRSVSAGAEGEIVRFGPTVP